MHALGGADSGVVYGNAAILVSADRPLVANGAVFVDGDRIGAAGSRDSVLAGVPAGTPEVDMGGATLSPGLIDGHQHLATPPVDRYASAQLERELFGGVTAVRVMGDDLRAVAELARRAWVHDAPSPDVEYAALFAGPSFFEDPRTIAASVGHRPGTAPWMQAVSASTDLREAITLARGTGASAVKIYADLPPVLVARITAEAHRQGLAAWAHGAVFPAGPSDVVRAGVDAVSHARYLMYEGQEIPERYRMPRIPIDLSRFRHGLPAPILRLLDEMADRGCVLDATLLVDVEDGAPNAFLAVSGRIAREAADRGVVVAAGTDVPAAAEDPFPALHQELALLVEWAGFTAAEALGAATTGSAAALGRRSSRGSLEPGKFADMLVTTSDPSVDLGALRSISATMKRGRWVARTDFSPAAAASLRVPPG